MSGYVLTPSAERDLHAIHEYVAAESASAAEQLEADIRGAIERLAEFPHTGRVRAGLLASDVRFWVVRTFLVLYRADETPIEILRIVSGYRDLFEELAWGVSEAVELEAAYA